MADNNADIKLLAGLNIDSSEAEILKAIKIIEKRLKANHDARFKLNVDIDETVLRNTVDKLQNILKGKELKIDTKASIEAITKEVNAMSDIVTVAKKAAIEKLEFAKANERVRNSADDTAEAVNRERSAMDSLGDVESILNGINQCGQNGNSVFQRFGNTLRDAFSTYTTVNLLEEGLNKVVDAGREAIATVKEFDDEATSLRMATGESSVYVSDLMNNYNALGQEIGAITSEVSQSADEWLRQGHTVEDTNTLIQDSMILSKVSNLESEKSTKYLTSAMQGYKVAVEDVIGIVDKLSAVDMVSATDAGGLAEAMSRTAQGAEIAGISMDRLLGMIAATGEVTQKSMSSIGETFKTIFSRMRNIKDGNLSLIGDDGEIEDLSNVEIVLDGLDIKLRDSNLEFRNFQAVLDEVAGSWNSYSSVQQAAIAKSFSGVRNQENFLVMMENWDKVVKYTNVAATSSGQATEKFGYYLESLEAKTESLKASLEKLATTTISDELYASVLDVSKEVVDLTTETGILKSTLTGLGVGGSLYAFSQLAVFLRESTQGLSNFSAALNMVDTHSVITANELQTLVDLSHGLSNSQMRLLLSTNNLTDAQKISLMVANGVERELAEQQLQTWGLINVQNAATNATVTLASATRGLMAVLVANPIVLVTMAVTAGVTAFNKYKQAQEEIIQSAREASAAYKESASSVDDYVTRYEELHQTLLNAKDDEEQTYNIKQQLLSLQTELNEIFGEEAGRINLVSDAYRNQIEAIKELSQASANSFLNENRKGIEKATKEMSKEKTYTLSSKGVFINADDSELVEQIQAIAERNNIEFGTFGYEFTGDANEATETITKFMNELRELQSESGKTSDSMSDIFDSLLDKSAKALEKSNDIIDEYGEIYTQAQMAQIATNADLSKGYNEAVSAVEAYNEAMLRSEDLYNDENVKKAWDDLQRVKQGIQENAAEWGQYSIIMDNVFASANDKVYSFYDSLKNDETISGLVEELRGLTDVEVQSMANDGTDDAFDKLVEKAKAYGLEIQDVIDLLIELGVVQGKVVSTKEETAISISDIFAMEDAQKNATLLFNYKDQLLEVESAYQTCLSAKEEYDKQGYLSIETLEKVLLLGEDYLQYLFDEQGNVKLDAEAFKQLSLARINDMEAQALNNLAQNIQQITDEATATEYLASKQNELANSYTDVAASALIAMHSIAGFSDSEALQSAYNSFKTQYNQIKGLFVSTRQGLDKTYTGVSTSAVEDATQKSKEYIESYMDFQKKSLEKGIIDYNTYCNTVSNLLKRMYKEGKLAGKDYYDYQKKMLESKKDIMDRVLSAVTNRIDEEISAIEKQKDAIQSTIDKLREENEEHERAVNLEKAKYDLARLQTQRTKKLYAGSGKGFVYTTDDEAIRDAQKNLQDLQFEEVIAGLEKEKDALDKDIQKLEDYKKQWQSVTDKYQKEQDELLAAQMFGAGWEDKILSGRLDILRDFESEYLRIQQSIVDMAWQSANEQNKAMNSIGTGDTDGGAEITKTSSYGETPYWTYKSLGTYDNIGEAHSMAGSNDVIKVGSKYQVVKWIKGFATTLDALKSKDKDGVYKRYHTGLEQGIIGSDEKNKNFELLKKLCLERNLKRDEVPIIAKRGEVVLTPLQVDNMSENFRKLYEYSQTHPIIPSYTPNFNLPKLDSSMMNKTMQQNVTIGDIHLHDVQNVKDFGAELNKYLPSVSIQFRGKL